MPDPPRGVGGELESTTKLESVDRLHEAEVAFLNQVEERKTAVHVPLGDRHDQTEIGLHQVPLLLANGVLGGLNARVAPAKLGARQADARLQLIAAGGARFAQQMFQRVKLFVYVAQLGDDVVDECGTNRERGELVGDGFSRARNLLLELRLGLLHESRALEPRPCCVDDRAATFDTAKRLQDRLLVLVAYLAALRKEDQLRRRVALCANSIGERDEGLNRGRNVAERDNEVALRIFDALTNRALLGRLQELAFADVLEICADKVDLLTANRWTGFELVVLGLVVFSRPGADDLVFEGLGLFRVQNLFGIRYERLTLLEVLAGFDRQPKVPGAMAPVENVRLFGRVVPLDERRATFGRPEGQRTGAA